MNVGKSLKIAMVKRGMSRDELAQQLFCSAQYVHQLCTKEDCGMGTVKKLADTFGMKVSEFLALGED